MRNLLDIKLLSQTFETIQNPDQKLDNAKGIAQMYSQFENCIAVLSDMKARKSFLYYGDIAGQLGLSEQDHEIRSIWEDQLLNKIHPEDLQKKYRLEFQFFQHLHTLPAEERMDYEVITKLRIKNRDGKYVLIKHRLLYITSSDDGSIWLALCLYQMIYDHPEFEVPQGIIINNKSGKIIEQNEAQFKVLLSSREKEVLRLIKCGLRSKEIADKLMLSINTVNRHRQNIFQKLNASNAMEACRMAKTMGLVT